MKRVVMKASAYQNTQPSIGYTFRYYATQMNKDISKNIKLLAINGIAPTVENIRNGAYPYIVEVYMVTREKPSREAQKFVDWFVNPQGQSFVEDVGYVPLYKTISANDARLLYK
ncbi:phosphate ABC transporter substrate-binding protein [Salmonella enterica subsp. enterica]|uniref:Phosphate ABC transporter substrate-binding protein n=1 Tax=Salmonella enterica subsp. enterica serovar Kalamu TaxID=2564590 RepID=A0A5V8Y8U3_SALET|nr:phosphate ABC transporter substrate-binding protein [Salmonella enterica]EBV0849319.1 phosphate ABC transporter substrate-binding protein [Salmonella enterica subsp. enterica serovar Fulica]EBV3279119.1 phosphate ABC transporter substrate-binding protein [Salmonella enterica subsp. enterica serovar Wangata]EBV4912987.1 phosphate ABC transporter substrate-binding protein [Salmonella enterica subsp. enterica serovar Kalamu]ECI6613171.1 phosphate ABC transporter substrate-binding protein [Salmo